MKRTIVLVASAALLSAGVFAGCGKKGQGYDQTRTGSDYYTESSPSTVQTYPSTQGQSQTQSSPSMQGQGTSPGQGSQWSTGQGVSPGSGTSSSQSMDPSQSSGRAAGGGIDTWDGGSPSTGGDGGSMYQEPTQTADGGVTGSESDLFEGESNP
jgi:hypothetical protein